MSGGRALGVADSSITNRYVTMPYGPSIVSNKLVTFGQVRILTAIRGVVVTAGTGGACTLQFVKCSNGQSLANGTVISQQTFNLVGTADAMQTLTVTPNTNVYAGVYVVPGDSIGFIMTGTPTSAVGCVTMIVEPVS